MGTFKRVPFFRIKEKEMDRISFDNGNKKIEINDSGDYIVIPMGDNSFPKRMIDFSDYAENKYKILYDKEIELKDSGIEKISAMRSEIFTDIGNSFDELFGPESCVKVFGNNAPSQDIMIDFMEQIEPLVRRYAEERRSEIEKKYNKRSRR